LNRKKTKQKAKRNPSSLMIQSTVLINRISLSIYMKLSLKIIIHYLLKWTKAKALKQKSNLHWCFLWIAWEESQSKVQKAMKLLRIMKKNKLGCQYSNSIRLWKKLIPKRLWQLKLKKAVQNQLAKRHLKINLQLKLLKKKKIKKIFIKMAKFKINKKRKTAI